MFNRKNVCIILSKENDSFKVKYLKTILVHEIKL